MLGVLQRCYVDGASSMLPRVKEAALLSAKFALRVNGILIDPTHHRHYIPFWGFA